MGSIGGAFWGGLAGEAVVCWLVLRSAPAACIWRTSLNPTINAMASLLILLSVGSTFLALRVSRYRGYT